MVSASVSFFVYLYFKSVSCAMISFLSGILIDIDHIFDFLLNHSIKEYRTFFKKCYELDFKKLVLLLHSYELTIILWLYVALASYNKYWLCFAIGFTQHMLLDVLFNPLGLKGYSMIFRIFNKFETKKIFKNSFLGLKSEYLKKKDLAFFQIIDEPKKIVTYIKKSYS